MASPAHTEKTKKKPRNNDDALKTMVSNISKPVSLKSVAK